MYLYYVFKFDFKILNKLNNYQNFLNYLYFVPILYKKLTYTLLLHLKKNKIKYILTVSKNAFPYNFRLYKIIHFYFKKLNQNFNT